MYRALPHRRRSLRWVSVFLSLGPVNRQLLTIKQKIGSSGERTIVPIPVSNAQLKFIFASIMGQLTLVRFRVGRRLSYVIFTHGR